MTSHGALADLTRRAAVASRLTARRLTPGRRGAPDFIVIGAQKCGTSTLMARLGSHPQVLPPVWREVHYFDLHHQRPTAWYEAHFATRRQRRHVAERHGRVVTGEASPYYLMHPSVPTRVHDRYPGLRMIAILRDPVARAVSHYHHAVRHGFEHRPIEQALDVEADARAYASFDETAFDDPRGPARRFLYVSRGHYADQLARWFELFARDQILVLTTDGLRDGSAIVEVCDFLGLEAAKLPTIADRNVQRYGPPAPRLVETLHAHYEEHDRRLAALLGASLPWAAEHTGDGDLPDVSPRDSAGA